MIAPFHEKRPVISPSAYVDLTAQIYGNVVVEEQSAIFSYCVLRGDINQIAVGKFTNIQEHSVMHVSDEHSCLIKDWVTIGHRAVLHGATVEKGGLIGIGAVVLDGSVIGEEAWVAAGAVVLPGTRVPPRTIAGGIPAKILRELEDREIQETYRRAKRYIEVLAPWYKKLQEKEVHQ
jgi:carbonic anhydrase/acetyltransferase-like protein (isoleucine patch superfamily)